MPAVLVLYAALWLFFFFWSIGALLYARIVGLAVQKVGLGGISDKLIIKTFKLAGYNFELGWGFLPSVELGTPSNEETWKQIILRGATPLFQLLFVVALYMIFVLNPEDFAQVTASFLSEDEASAEVVDSEPAVPSVQALVDQVIGEYGLAMGSVAVIAGFLFVIILAAIPVASVVAAITFIDAFFDKRFAKKSHRVK